jgi:uracil-DNA glycosylase
MTVKTQELDDLLADIRTCRLCAETLPLGPRPVVQAGSGARLLIIGQAPGAKVHESGVPWDDASGERLRQWTGLAAAAFYDPRRVALMPMGFCYPGRAASGDKAPRRECAPTWHAKLRRLLGDIRLTLLVGSYAQGAYLDAGRLTMTEAVRRAGASAESTLSLPHPSWRSVGWMQRNPWFEAETLPVLRERVRAALAP